METVFIIICAVLVIVLSCYVVRYIDLSSEDRQLKTDLANAKKAAEYWRAEHERLQIVFNTEITRLRKSFERKRGANGRFVKSEKK